VLLSRDGDRSAALKRGLLDEDVANGGGDPFGEVGGDMGRSSTTVRASCTLC
jgi:hypothetical protein